MISRPQLGVFIFQPDFELRGLEIFCVSSLIVIEFHLLQRGLRMRESQQPFIFQVDQN